jgi:hypothetical protein
VKYFSVDRIDALNGDCGRLQSRSDKQGLTDTVRRRGCSLKGPLMTRRFFHVLMFMALIVCIASLIHTTLARSEPCPLCGGRTECIGAMQNRTHSHKLVSTSKIYRCHTCDYEFMMPPD